jgi:polyisoprenoid-binding protein YceI
VTKSSFSKLLVTAGLLAVAADLAAAQWNVEPQTSVVTMYATKEGQWFSGVFEEFTATIDFDYERPEAGKIVGVVRTGSIDTNDNQNDTYVTGYLNVEEFPEARFASTTIEKTADGYRANGELDLAGHQQPVILEFTFVPESPPSASTSQAQFTGTMTINRFDFDIASEVDTNAAGQDVIVQVVLGLSR